MISVLYFLLGSILGFAIYYFLLYRTGFLDWLFSTPREKEKRKYKVFYEMWEENQKEQPFYRYDTTHPPVKKTFGDKKYDQLRRQERYLRNWAASHNVRHYEDAR